MGTRRTLWIALAALLFWAPVSAQTHPLSYSAKPISGRVVDRDTGRPLECVIVLAQWVLADDARIHVAEVVTNASGQYFIPGWGPKARPPSVPLTGYSDPEIMYFKPPYAPRWVANRFLDNTDAVRTSDWDGKTIELKKFDGAVAKWERQLDAVLGALGHRGRYTRWQDHPRTLLALFEEIKRLPPQSQVNLSEIEEFRTTEHEVRAYLERGAAR